LVDWAAAEGLSVTLSPIHTGEVAGINVMLTRRGELRAMPHHWADLGGIDGFYAVRFVKN
jgi:hypothetical protein